LLLKSFIITCDCAQKPLARRLLPHANFTSRSRLYKLIKHTGKGERREWMLKSEHFNSWQCQLLRHSINV